MTRRMGTGYTLGQMGRSTMGSGAMGNRMETDCTYFQTECRSGGSGKTESA